MNGKLLFVLGIVSALKLADKLYGCASCDESVFWFEMPGYIYIAIELFFSIVLLYGGYVQWQKDKKVTKKATD